MRTPLIRRAIIHPTILFHSGTCIEYLSAPSSWWLLICAVAMFYSQLFRVHTRVHVRSIAYNL